MLKDSTDPQALLGEQGLLKQLTKRVVAWVRAADLTAHLGDAPPHVRHGPAAQQARNGQGQKTGQTDTGPWAVAVPRDRHGSVAPPRVPQRQRRLAGFDAPVGDSVGPGALDPGALRGIWKRGRGRRCRRRSSRPARRRYETRGAPPRAGPVRPASPLRYCEALGVKARQAGPVQTQAVSLALGLTLDGAKARLGLGHRESEGAQCWLSGCTKLQMQNRGVPAACMACVDGLTGLPEATAAVWPHPQGPWCMVPKVRNCLTSVPWQERRAVAAARRALSGAATLPAAAPARTFCRALGGEVACQQCELAGRWGPVDGVLGLAPGPAASRLDAAGHRVVARCAAEGAARSPCVPT